MYSKFETCEAMTNNGKQCLNKAKIRTKPTIENCNSDIDPITLEPISQVTDTIIICHNNLAWCYDRENLIKYLKQMESSVVKFILPIVFLDRIQCIEMLDDKKHKVYEFEETDYTYEENKKVHLLVPFKDFVCNQYCTKHFDKWSNELVDKIFAEKQSGIISVFDPKEKNSYGVKYTVENDGNFVKMKNLKSKEEYTKNKIDFIDYLQTVKPRKITYGIHSYVFFRPTDYDRRSLETIKKNQEFQFIGADTWSEINLP